MNKVLIMVIVGLSLTGCGRIDNYFSHAKSKWIGINRTVTLYADDGKIIKTWKVDNTIEYPGTGMRFVDKDGKTVTIAGTIIAEEN